jgi:UPF0271 protein
VTDLNCDMGESFGAYSLGEDAAILPFVTSINVACGFHAGDPSVMDRTVARALSHGVAVGAHPSHLDLRGFGRRTIAADPKEVENDVVYQIGALAAFVGSHGGRLVHVKPHGALYNQAARDEPLARAIAAGIARVDRSLIFVGLASSWILRRAAADAGLRFAAEAFADRRYCADGSLQPRSAAGAVIAEPAAAAEQAVSIARDRRVRTVDGSDLALEADTLCLHGDTPGAAQNARAVRRALEAAGVRVAALDR